ncbi:MAG: phytoene/squalene synthase family protein [Maricaulaceae bacterium]
MKPTNIAPITLPNDLVSGLKDKDPDRYRASLFAPKDMRARLHVLYGFHAELAKIPEIVSEPMIGAIRYQWWREAIAEIYEGKPVRKHEIATPLAAVLLEADVPRFWVDRLIDGRERDIDPEPFRSADETKDYAARTSGVLMQIAARLLDDDFDAERALKAGEAWGLTGILRGWGYYTDGMLSEVSFEDIANAAQASYAAARGSAFKTEIIPAVAYGALVPKFLNRLTHSRHDPTVNVVHYAPLLKQFRMMRAAMTGKI